MGVDSAAIALPDEGGQTLTIRAARGLEEEAVGRLKMPVGRGFVGHIAKSRKPLMVDDLSTLEMVSPILWEQVRSAAGVPLLVEEQLVGVLYVGSATARHFTEQDAELLQLTADRIAPAVDRARLYAAEQDARARAEEALARATLSEAQATERAEQLQTILETIADGVAVSDQDGRIIQTNRAYRELLGLDRATGFDMLLPADRGLLLDMRDATGEPLPPEQFADVYALRGEQIEEPNADIRVRSLDGRELELNVSAAPLRDRDGHIVGTVTVTRDITWRKGLEREREEARARELALQETTQRMDEFLATAAHDLRSPLAVAVGTIDLAALRSERLASTVSAENPSLADKIGQVQNCLDEAGRSLDRLSRLVAVLFDVSRARTGTLELHCMPCNLASVAREQVAALRMAHPSRTIHFEVLGGRALRVVADADRIGQVLMNYLTNALKYAPEDQPVEVRVAAEGTAARVSVRDRGPGLPIDEQARIWQRFYRVLGGKVRSGSNTGLGLGLHICKTIVELHGGQVGVESAPGEGSTFWFTLPLASKRA